ncbi:DUF3348 domain-containing protein [Variovorax sp. Sphag1AA]|uniref:DUF3348 domain-containing protein n=1 Tax=Variovorax sp. Sphag1AA TaxID=2587027 RepID=UPI00160780AB|nr:DUF3348 domain-containing protein [Variovorax sp. Sphag1AA]MBB3178538.1 hypothetical protein [Variovorax sp. Sphag1AA]
MRRSLTGSALIRLLDRLAGPDVRESGASTSDRLSQWFSWTDAISLSAALDGVPVAGASGTSSGKSASRAEEGECQRVRAALTKAIAEDSTFAAPQQTQTAADDAETDFSPYRQRYQARQQAIEAGVGALRGKLRSRLAARSPEMAKLAAVDVVMEQVLGTRERSLLSTVPKVLEKHFGRLRQDAESTETGAWLDIFRRDARDVLLAELDFRFQPVEGLLDALRMK